MHLHVCTCIKVLLIFNYCYVILSTIVTMLIFKLVLVSMINSSIHTHTIWGSSYFFLPFQSSVRMPKTHPLYYLLLFVTGNLHGIFIPLMNDACLKNTSIKVFFQYFWNMIHSHTLQLQCTMFGILGLTSLDLE